MTGGRDGPHGVPDPSPEFLRLVALPRRDLEQILARGEAPDPGALSGWEFRGANTPWWARLLGIRKFIKGFYRDDRTGAVMGYNVRVAQNDLSDPWTARLRNDVPKRFGFFRVGPIDPAGRHHAYRHALFLDYGAGGNRALDPTGMLRDYLVRVEPGSDDLLLGKGSMVAGPVRSPASYFVLERLRPARSED